MNKADHGCCDLDVMEFVIRVGLGTQVIVDDLSGRRPSRLSTDVPSLDDGGRPYRLI